MNEEGWYQDPYKRHEDRWFSDGSPTALVRDGEVEAQDPPPAGDQPGRPYVPSMPQGPAGGPDDLKRADDAETGAGPHDPDYGEAATDASVFFPTD
jgi:hypothetical protein